jgi:AmmeMemoRadiSam system protein B
MSIPTRRYDQSRQMIPELLKIGHYLSDYFASSNEKAIIIISGDLAHTHSQEGPYEFSEKAEQFDSLIEKWVKSGDKRLLLNDASEILDQALCCGYTGLVLLQGILEKTNLKSNFLIRAHPTYYGMLVASFS